MTRDSHSPSTLFPWAKLFVNDMEVPVGEDFTLYGGHDNKVKIEDTSGQITHIRLGLADSTLKIDAAPDFLDEVSPVDGVFNWSLKPVDNQSGAANIVFFTTDDTEVLEVSCKIVPNVSFRFIDLGDRPLPVPPAVVDTLINVPLVPGVLLASQGVPVEGVTVHFTVPDHESSQDVTGPLGKANADAFLYTTVGQRTLRAVAELQAGEVSVELLLNFNRPQSLE